IGWLFGSRNDTRRKENLVVFVTPHIVKDANDADRLTQFMADQVGTANADVFFERGYVKKQKTKFHNRTKWRPGQDEMEGVGQPVFERGEMER
ncbi:MAG: hypothetical protein GY851_03930, partial [bacterium]|nr:hypothetical protein [bacterium]